MERTQLESIMVLLRPKLLSLPNNDETISLITRHKKGIKEGRGSNDPGPCTHGRDDVYTVHRRSLYRGTFMDSSPGICDMKS